MELSQGLKYAFRPELAHYEPELAHYEQEKQMPYVTSIEQMGIEQERRAIALNLLRENLPLATIVKVTGLSLEQVQALQTNL